LAPPTILTRFGAPSTSSTKRQFIFSLALPGSAEPTRSTGKPGEPMRYHMTVPKPGTAERREYEKLQKRKSRAAAKAARSPQDFRAELEKVWQANRDLLTGDAREALHDRIHDFRVINDLLAETIKFLRFGQSIRVVYPDLNFESIEAFAKDFPPTDGIEFHHLAEYDEEKITEIETAPFYFREYGLAIDTIDHTKYYDFIHLFGVWLRDNRAAVNDPDIVRLIQENERLTPPIAGRTTGRPERELAWRRDGYNSFSEWQKDRDRTKAGVTALERLSGELEQERKINNPPKVPTALTPWKEDV
jgi:hypothetical protein